MSPDLEKQEINEPAVAAATNITDSPKPRPDSQNPSKVPSQGSGVTGEGGQSTANISSNLEAGKPELAYDAVAATHDYTVKYKPDPLFCELDEDARVWQVYNDEANAFDTDMLEEASDNIDVLMIFAGLFSAVVTTFVTQTAQALSPDNAAISASLLMELVQLQRAGGNQTLINSIPPADITSGPSVIDNWVNGLWFMSLTLSLASALLAVLAKQWLRSYRSTVSGTSRDRALMRQFKHVAFDRWNVRYIIGFLPTILHASLILFLIGLVLFLSPLNTAITIAIGASTIILLTLYIIANFIPLKFIECPYRTPLTDLAYQFLRLCLANCFRCRDIKEEQKEAVLARSDFHKGIIDGEHETLKWLLETTGNPSAKKIAHQGMWALHPSSPDVICDKGEPGDISPKVMAGQNRCGTNPELFVDGEQEYWLQTQFREHCENVMEQVRAMFAGYASLTQSEKDDMQRALISTINYNETYAPKYAFFLYQTKPIVFPPSDLGLALITMACRGVEPEPQICWGDQDSGNPLITQSNVFSWLIDNYTSLQIPSLPPVVWAILQEKGGWKLPSNRGLDSTTKGFKNLLTKSFTLTTKTGPPRGPIPLERYIRNQIGHLSDQKRYVRLAMNLESPPTHVFTERYIRAFASVEFNYIGELHFQNSELEADGDLLMTYFTE